MTSLRLITLICILLIGLSANASEQNFKVGDVKLSSTDWGIQKASIKLTCLSEYYRFVVVTAEVNFPGSIIESKRFAKRNYIIEPPDEVGLDLSFIIPGNIGKGEVLITLYDVIDTLDPLMASQKFHEREFNFNIKLSKPLQALADSGIQVPSMVSRTETFDNIFNRILILLLHRGKSPDEIARLAGVTVEYTEMVSLELAKGGLLDLFGTEYRPSFVIIESDRAGELMPVINGAVDNIYKTITANVSLYDSTVEALASQGIITRDRSSAMHGGAVLYHKFPTFLGLFFWDHLGSAFVNDGNDFRVFEASDPCLAQLGDYMFMVTGTKDNVGTTFYNKFDGPNSKGFYCGATSPILQCDGKSWAFEKGNSPIYYPFNKEKIREPLSILAEGVFEHLTGLEKTLVESFPEDNDREHFKGVRYWCWGLVVEGLMNRLVENGILEQEGNGTFLMQETDR
jgi:hypothetical protein